VLGLGVVVAAFLSAPTFAVWCLAFLKPSPPGARTTTPPRGGMENDMSAML